ncbi:MAG: ASPIC/UnbV domain-containing protein, partial [Cellvibrionales bacterium]|nr:ASPIC/UnbV domain-containing protein [Cellvibrionales bacterium]
NDLFISDKSQGKLSYTLSTTVGRGYNSTGWSWGADFFDYDNDADDDLYVLNGMNEYAVYSERAYEENIDNPAYSTNGMRRIMPVKEKETNVFFTNQDGKLINTTIDSGLDVLINSRSAAYLDFDNDGDLDVAVNNFHADSLFFENTLNSKETHSLSIRLIGNPMKKTNRDAIGAKIVATLPDGNKIYREVSSSRAYLTTHPKEQHIGLGQYQLTDVIITWPNGEKQVITQLKSGHRYFIHQGGEVKIVAQAPLNTSKNSQVK